MNNVRSQTQGFSPIMNQPCPGCTPGMPGQSGLPMTTMPPTTPSRQDLLSQMPTGIPQGPSLGTAPNFQQNMLGQPPSFTGMNPMMPMQDTTAIMPWNQPMPVTVESLQYMNGFMRTQIGRRVTIEFLIGTNTLTDRTGTLLAVGEYCLRFRPLVHTFRPLNATY